MSAPSSWTAIARSCAEVGAMCRHHAITHAGAINGSLFATASSSHASSMAPRPGKSVMSREVSTVSTW